MKRVPRPFSAVCLALLFSALTLHAGFSHASESLARSKNCFSCHALDEKLIGPSLRDVAHKYAPTRSAAQDAALAEKIMLGGSGVWGLIPKPPNAQVSLPEAE